MLPVSKPFPVNNKSVMAVTPTQLCLKFERPSLYLYKGDAKRKYK